MYASVRTYASVEIYVYIYTYYVCVQRIIYTCITCTYIYIDTYTQHMYMHTYRLLHQLLDSHSGIRLDLSEAPVWDAGRAGALGSGRLLT